MGSRRPSDPIRVPETLEEADSLNYDDQSPERAPLSWASNASREQWHRDRWLSDESNSKHYSDKSTDIDSGTEMIQISESECEDCNGSRHQDSITSSCSLSANFVASKRASFSMTKHVANVRNSYDCDSESEFSCLTQYYEKSCHDDLPDNNNLAQSSQAHNHKVKMKETKFHESDKEVRIPLTTPDGHTSYR